jgi:hypothetical protein
MQPAIKLVLLAAGLATVSSAVAILDTSPPQAAWNTSLASCGCPSHSFFEEATCGPLHAEIGAASVEDISNYLATADGIRLTKAFMPSPNKGIRQSMVRLVAQIANSDDQ